MYYYDAVTRETSWVRPTAANVITQTELEALAAANAAEKAQTSKSADASDAAGVCQSFHYLDFVIVNIVSFS